jgi:hypothetical protein
VFSKKRRFLLSLVILCNLFLISGCLNQKTTPEKMYEVMEKVVNAENTFEEQQDPLVLAEKKEKELYDQIISLGMKEFDQIVKLADEALLLVEERKKLMELETKSIVKSQEQFEELLPYIKKLDDPAMKKDAKNLYNVMMERYNLHNELEESYSKALQYDQELYQLFKNKDLTLIQIEDQINKINKIYEDVYKLNEKFNEQTQKYNDLKLQFYEKAGFKIENQK